MIGYIAEMYFISLIATPQWGGTQLSASIFEGLAMYSYIPCLSTQYSTNLLIEGPNFW